MNIKETIAAINGMQADGVIEGYAIPSRRMTPDSQWRPELIDLGQIEGVFGFEEGFCRPQWQVIAQAIEQRVTGSLDLDLAWTEAAHQWLSQLRIELQPGRDHSRVVVRSAG